MSLNLIAILISLAMMLTGAGGEGMPAEASRTLTLRDVSLTYNGERVNFDPMIRLGAYSDGETALFDFGVDMGGDTLLPVQLAADENGLTALFEKSDVAVNVAAQALEALTENVSLPTTNGGDSEMMTYMTQVYFPAYVNMLAAVKDEALLEEMQAKANAVVDELIDRGEGKPVTEEVEGKAVELTEYVYTIDSAQMAALSDAILTSNDTFKAYYDAMFGLFARMPEETGISGLSSYAELFEKTGLDISMEMDEKVSGDGDIQLVDAVLKMDMSAMIAGMAGEGEEIPEISPMVMNIHGTKAGKNQVTDMEMTFAADAVEMKMSMRATQSDSAVMMDMDMDLSENGQALGSVRMDIGGGTAGAAGNEFTHANLNVDVGEQGGFDFSFQGTAAQDGSAEGDFDIGFEAEGVNVRLAFVAETSPNAIENHVTGHTPDLVIDDLSQEGMSALAQDQAAAAALIKVSGTMMADVQKLASDEGVQALMALFTPVEASVEEAPGEPEPVEAEDEEADGDEGPADYVLELTEDENGEYVIDLSQLEGLDLGDYGFQVEDTGDEDYEEVEDDGVLGFEVPEITWLPDGWVVDEHEENTAYDWADVTFVNKAGEDSMYALFFADEENVVKTYIVADDGAVEPVEGREISVTDFGEEGLSVSWHMNGLYYNLMFYSSEIDLDTIGRIVAGIRP